MTSDVELLIGRVVKAHGIRGEVAVDITTDEPDIRFAIGEVLTGKQAGKQHQLTIAKARAHQGRLLITFKEISDRNAAESLRGTQFFAPPLEDDEDDDGFYDHELEGLHVIHNGADIGTVTEITHGPAGTLLTVTLNSGKEAMIPFVHAIVPDVDLDAGQLTITPPDGLLEL
ncbi:ribosome maturation factor RimM [Corynebacterium aquilae]|uniref:Ribosome maturation factor RimM n=1 Tax=Corynebacterium aquilae DSM 44791 TaxID=1431546 RepID=A0A1L7CGP8_9CORY|nr:ribosome maturation factor RimM [Corynebacterium aquilae]APT85016.1 16S rRNA processing protein RimM [Corynebacterium aquilae DSM 44791]